jgi:uncharacterized membrane protein
MPENLEINAGESANITLTLKNQGHLRGSACLTISAFDTLYQEHEIALEPGAEIQIKDIIIDAPSDCPTGNYPFNYTLSGSGVLNGLKTGNFTFKVNGISLNVEASLDRSLYNIGENAQLTLTISSTTLSNASTPLEAMVNWGNFSEKRSFVLSSGSSGSTSLTFEIPLDEKRREKGFLRYLP